MPRTIAALRGALYNAMVSPALVYQIDLEPTQTLASTSVFPRAVYEPTPAGTSIAYPAVFIDVAGDGSVNRYLYGVIKASAKVWVVSGVGPGECTAIADAITVRLSYADQNQGWDAADLSTAGGAGALPVIFRQLKQTRYSGAAYEQNSSRWYNVMEYSIIAQ